MHEQTPAPNIPAPDSSPSPHADVSPTPVDFDLDGDALREECRVLGVFGHHETGAITALGQHALRHRGQEAAATVHSRDATILRDLLLFPYSRRATARSGTTTI
jgi:hypothetical protein